MVVLTLLLTSVIFQITPEKVVADEIFNPGIDDQFLARMQTNKRYVGSLAKNKHPPTVQQRSYFMPPLISPYGKQRPTSVDELDGKGKRYLGALARTGDLNFSKSQQKRTVDFLQSDADEASVDGKDLPDQELMKRDMIAYLEPFILKYLNEFNRTYDRRKVELFLSNLVNAIFGQTESISIEKLKTLVQSNYFQPEESGGEFTTNDTSKRNLQALLRERNNPYRSATRTETQSSEWTRPSAPQYRESSPELIKRNLQSLIKNKLNKRHLGSVARTYNPRAPPNKRDSVGGLLDYLGAIAATPYDEDLEYASNPVKRHTMYDINEPDITFEYQTQAGEQADYNDYAEQDTHPISIGKRHLGALARNGWLQGFGTPRLNRIASSPSSYEKKHIGSLAHIGWLPTTRTAGTPTKYYHYNYLRNDRQREFRPPLYRGPRALYSQSEPPVKTKQVDSCNCKRNVDISGAAAFARSDLGELGQSTPPAASTSTGDVSTREGTRLLSKRSLIVPTVNRFSFRQLYPDKLLQTTYNDGFPAPTRIIACSLDSEDCFHD